MFQIKPISKESIPKALEKAERYRLLNEPMLAESICLDVLLADPGNEKAVVVMILAISDQFGSASVDCEQRMPSGRGCIRRRCVPDHLYRRTVERLHLCA